MRKRFLFAAVALVASGLLASAQESVQEQAPVRPGWGRMAGNMWVDANDNGICDHVEDGTRPGRRPYSAGAARQAGDRGPGWGQGRWAAAAPGAGYGMGRGQAARQGMGRGPAMAGGRGAGFRASMIYGTVPARAAWAGPGRGRFNGRGPAFMDENNNGICDYLEKAIEAEKK